MPRYIAHLDMDAFYASVELLRYPELRGRPMVIGGRRRRAAEGGVFPTLREYAREFGLNATRLTKAKPNAIVMHPGPMNRGVEISEEVADGPRSVVLHQVESGVAVRMAVLYMCASEPGTPVTTASY